MEEQKCEKCGASIPEGTEKPFACEACGARFATQEEHKEEQPEHKTPAICTNCGPAQPLAEE